MRSAVPSQPPRPRDLLAGLRLPPGLPSLVVPLHLAFVTPDDPEAGVSVTVGPGWTVTTTSLSRDLVYDAVLAGPAALIRGILTGVADPGWATVHGSVTGTLVGQSALAFLVEAIGGNGVGDAIGTEVGHAIVGPSHDGGG
jgi:hypothetical protein